MRGNGSMKRPKRPQIQQRSQKPDCSGWRTNKPVLPLGCSGAISTAGTSTVPHSNDAGEVIEREL
jgi:hypothetical protein